jgi:hypothetical protein
MVLPIMNSYDFNGVTISCSMVPSSFSLMMAIEVRIKEVIMTRTATMPGTKKYWLLRLGLYQVLMRASNLP